MNQLTFPASKATGIPELITALSACTYLGHTIMSHPSLLEYSLSSSYPFSGWLSKLLSIAEEVWVCPTLPVFRLKDFSFFHLTHKSELQR
jgi:hypothetical protein